MKLSGAYWSTAALVKGILTDAVRITPDSSGRIAAVQTGVSPAPTDVRLGTVIPGMGNAHSHAFHRLLRGRTHSEGGDFWKWRTAMYRAATSLDPERYLAVARAVFAEMLVCGWTAVGEFHYIHRRPDGSAYDTEHAMEIALATAARQVGIRLVLLDTVYLRGGFDEELRPEQLAFSDGSPDRWLERWHSLRTRLLENSDRLDPRRGLVTLGAAIHSVRAVSSSDIAVVLDGVPAEVPLHIHVSEQPAENVACLDRTGRTPTGVLSYLGALSPRLSLVHATHLTGEDVSLIGGARATVVMCPTTEADLGDGIGPARALVDAGARLALGSDQNSVVDPFLEMRGLEAGERLASRKRGRFDAGELLMAASGGGYAALGLGSHEFAVGDPCDLVEVSMSSLRTTGTVGAQFALTATAGDVEKVIVGGTVVAERGRLIESPLGVFSRRPENLVANALSVMGAEADVTRR